MDFLDAHVTPRVPWNAKLTLPVKTNVSLDPIAIGFFGSQAEMSEASYIAHLIKQLPVGHR
jgi:hypothetical protein